MSASTYAVVLSMDVEAVNATAAEEIVQEIMEEYGVTAYEIESLRRIAGPSDTSAIDFDEDEESTMLNEGALK